VLFSVVGVVQVLSTLVCFCSLPAVIVVEEDFLSSLHDKFVLTTKKMGAIASRLDNLNLASCAWFPQSEKRNAIASIVAGLLVCHNMNES